MNDLVIKDLIDIYFTKDVSNNKEYDQLFISKINPIFKQNLIQFFNDFMYQISYNTFNSSYQSYFTNIKYSALDQEKYKNFLITTAIKNFYQLNNENFIIDTFKPILSKKINNETMTIYYDIYRLAYDSIYNYFYDYLKDYIYLNDIKRKIYNKLINLTNKLLDSFNESKFINDYFYIYINTKYLIIQFYNENNKDTTGYTILQQSYSSLKDAIQSLNQYIEFNFKVNLNDIYYDNLIYSSNKQNIGLILSKQNFDLLIN